MFSFHSTRKPVQWRVPRIFLFLKQKPRDFIRKLEHQFKNVKQFEASEKVLIDTLFMKHVQSVTSRLKLPFELQQFQLQAAAVLYQDKSCILVARVPKGWN